MNQGFHSRQKENILQTEKCKMVCPFRIEQKKKGLEERFVSRHRCAKIRKSLELRVERKSPISNPLFPISSVHRFCSFFIRNKLLILVFIFFVISKLTFRFA